MMHKQPDSPSILSLHLWTVLAFVFGVLPLGLSSTEMWDGVVGIHALQTQNWITMKGWLLDSNWYLTYGLFLLADSLHQLVYLPYWVFFKLWIVLMIVGIAFEVKKLAQQVFEVPEHIAAWLPALVFSFPIWYVFFSYTPMLGHLTCVWLALAGYRLIYSDKKGLVLLGTVFVAVSFQLASNCAFVLALEMGRWAVSQNKRDWSYTRSALLLFLSVTVFAATRVIWPPVGTYVGYNRFLNPLSVSSWLAYAKYFAFFGTWLVLLLPAALGGWWLSRQQQGAGLMQTLLKNWKTPLFLAFVALAACAPYIAVGLGSPLFTARVVSSSSVSAVLASNSANFPLTIWYGGWGARHVLLLMIPLLVFAAWLANKAQKNTTPALAGALAATIFVSLAVGLPGHWAKLQRLAKDQAVVTALASKPPLPYGFVDLLLDSKEDFLSSIYETNDILYRAYGKTRWAALMLPDHPAVQAWGDEHRRMTLAFAEAQRPMIARLNLMNDYSWADTCRTVARVKLPEFSVWDVLWRTEHAPEQLPKTQITPVSGNCSGADVFWR